MSQAFATPLPQAPRPFAAVVPSAEPTQESMNRLLGQPIRYGILRALSAQETLSFSDLKRMMKITDGNLSMHARKLEDAQVVSCTKGFRGRFPRTEYRLTAQGRQVFEAFVSANTPA
jgi:DNA-binding HxlR family transcriptional regulator